MHSNTCLHTLIVLLSTVCLALTACGSDSGTVAPLTADAGGPGFVTDNDTGGATTPDTGVCAPVCDGRDCGDDGCGGTCGTCDGALICSPAGACVDLADCTDTCESVGATCGSVCGLECGLCGTNELCTNGQCECVPLCANKFCGDDGCGGTCGVCADGEVCDANNVCIPSADCTDTCESLGASCGTVCGTSCGECAADQTCSAAGVCEGGTCTPDCALKECGDDGCGGSCGGCPEAGNYECQADGTCACLPGCTEDMACGDDGCGGSCGDCGDGMACDPDTAQCVCAPSCEGLECGDDGCGGSCGDCIGEWACNAGICSCSPDCTDKDCGSNGCGGSCGLCPDGDTCNAGGTCEACVASCVDAECGDDGCGGSCGECGAESWCNAGTCDATPCLADCENKVCGPDGCGGSCGACGAWDTCGDNGQCVACVPACGGIQCGDDGCGGSCGVCAPGDSCIAGQCSECAPNCDGKTCGDDGCGGSCGTCLGGDACSDSGQCAAPYVEGALGTYCGPSDTCAPEILDPATGMMITNAMWPDCQHDQCDSGFCAGAGLPGVFAIIPACSQSCTITVDAVNNSTGLPGADGVEDPNTPTSDCTGFSDGPTGANWRCVNFGVPGSPSNSFCMPGSDFASCNKDSDCNTGEGCGVTTLGGLGQKCFAKVRSGDWGDGVPMTTKCNNNPYTGDINLCEQGLCYTMLGCTSFCETGYDCDTTQIYEDSGCDQATNTCIGWPSKNCLSDTDCSAWYCNEPGPVFSNVPEYTPQLCFPNVCDTVDDCPSDFYCRWFFNGEEGKLADWEHRCLARDSEGVGLGQPCDSDPTDNIPGDSCEASDLCVGGYCSALCNEDDQCGPEQVCRTEEANLDTVGDGVADTMLPLEYCITLPGKEGPCLSEETCHDEQKCGIYETHVPGDEETLTVAGYCHDTDPTWGTLGQSCGAAGAEVDQCENFCLGANSAAGLAGICTQTCETHTDCPDALLNGVSHSFRCQSYVYSYGLDPIAAEDNIYIGLCAPNSVNSSGADCSADFTCVEDTEACSAVSVNFGPDFPAVTDHVCLDVTGDGTYTPTKELGETCNATAPNDECKTMYCLADDSGVNGVCSAPCDPNNDQCGEGLACEEEVLFPRAGAYEANSGTVWRCNTAPDDCTPNCAGLECGDDGCGGSCGECGPGLTCAVGLCLP